MTTLLRVDASIRVDGSISRALADSAQASWQATHPGGTVIRRDLGRTPIPADVWATVVASMMWPAADQAGPELDAAKALSRELADEVIAADAVLLAVPLYNYGISQHVKTWIDLLITDPRLQPGGEQPLAGRPVLFTLARGGGYGPGAPREGWDHATPYLKRMFGDVFGMEIRESVAELTLAGHVPGMDELVDAAKQSKEAAHSSAEEHAAEIARTAA
ncbi:MAG TPA: NAD(P)H-dependent oxidoreductase [Kribbella sp.]|nr:NAD(P)H-dependent oxidoreductase [Kribbella sp.]